MCCSMDFPSRHIPSSCFPLFPVLKFCWAKLICSRLYQSFFPLPLWGSEFSTMANNFLESKPPHHECAALLHWKLPILLIQPTLSCYSWLLRALFTILNWELVWISPRSAHFISGSRADGSCVNCFCMKLYRLLIQPIRGTKKVIE